MDLRKRNRVAARARGTAMVEAIVVISVMIVFYGGMVYFESIYHNQIVVQSQARSAAVANAMGACQGSGGYTGPAPASIIDLPRTNQIPTTVGDITVAGQAGFMNGQLTALDMLSSGSFVDLLSADNATVAVTAGSNAYSQNVSSNAFAACADAIAVNGQASPAPTTITQNVQTAYTGPE
jgi:hypothetical protein